MMNIYIVGLNQLTDVEIDKVAMCDEILFESGGTSMLEFGT